MTDLFNYDTSWLNPALKMIICVIFVFVCLVYYRSRRHYAGDINRVLLVLFWVAFVGAVAALLRYFGHGTQFGFDSKYSLKWFQSLGYVIQASLFVIAAKKLAKGIIPEVRE